MLEERKLKVIPELEIADIENDVSLEELTRSEILKAMNSVNPDLKFIMELC